MNLNPFDLPGPQFLLFYGCFASVVIATAWLFRGLFEPVDEQQCKQEADRLFGSHYEVAALRGGAIEAVCVAVVSLLERRLLEAKGKRLANTAAAPGEARHPLDLAILKRFTQADDAREVTKDEVILFEGAFLVETARQQGLIPSPAIKSWRVLLIVIGVLLLGWVAAHKVAVALARGHYNVIFLILLAIGACVVLATVVWRRQTRSGKRVLNLLQGQFEGLKQRRDSLKANQTTGELGYLAAVYGMTMLPAFALTTVQTLHMRQQVRQGGDGGCGSSACGSSSCGGSSCGGGCGGGCGGCG